MTNSEHSVLVDTSQISLVKKARSRTVEAPYIRSPEGPRISWKDAGRIMGDDLLGADALLHALGGKLEDYGGAAIPNLTNQEGGFIVK